MTTKKVERLATAAQMIANLTKMPPNAVVYFDCPHCGKAGGFHKLSIAVMVTTKETGQNAA
jgi:hypothetical protein